LSAETNQIKPLVKNADKDSIFIANKAFTLEATAYAEGQFFGFKNEELSTLFKFKSQESQEEFVTRLKEYESTSENALTVFLSFDYKDGKYEGQAIVDKFQTDLEFRTFAGITIFCVAFGILVILLLKPLKRLTHGAEEKEVEKLEQEGYEIADDEVK
jgi:POT family proton-dependent oligopeptide transporter